MAVAFRCDDCGHELPFKANPVALDLSTGDVSEPDPEDVFDDGEELPDCPECGGNVDWHEEE